MGKGKFWSHRLRLELRRLDSRVLLVLNLILMMGVFVLFNSIWAASRHDIGGNNSHGKSCSNASSVVVGERKSAILKELIGDERGGEVSYRDAPRRFLQLGTGAFLFTLFTAHRTGPGSFAVIGLGPKMMHSSRDKPRFHCSWEAPSSPLDATNFSSQVQRNDVKHGTATIHYLPDKEFPNLEEYISMVVYCTFDFPVGIDGEGGELRMVADHGEYWQQTGLKSVEFVADIVDQSREYNASLYEAPFKYEYMYCGSPLYGSVNPNRMREWLAYHMRLLGPNSHFIMYDSGGLSSEVWRVLEPWVKLGRISIINVRQVRPYDTYNDGQLLFLNDCLFRSKTLAKWSLFFDIDEYLHLTHEAHLEESFHTLMSEMAGRGRRATSIQLEQRPMSHDHCVKNLSDPSAHERQWIFEKLVYRRNVSTFFTKGWTKWNDFKTIVQPKYVLTMGIHWAVEVEVPPGLTKDDTRVQLDAQYEGCTTCLENKLHYYHYHGTINVKNELCQEFMDARETKKEIDDAVHELDPSMASLGNIVKDFELRTIGPQQIR